MAGAFGVAEDGRAGYPRAVPGALHGRDRAEELVAGSHMNVSTSGTGGFLILGALKGLFAATLTQGLGVEDAEDNRIPGTV